MVKCNKGCDEMFIISACLIGENCKYDGKNNYNKVALDLFNSDKAIPVCPEELGGLSTPRVPSEIVGNKVVSKEGMDVTKAFQLGAIKTLEEAKKHQVKYAILQARSPSCGSKKIYDGTFSNTLIDGQGMTTKLLEKNGIKVITIEEYINGTY